MGLERCSFDIFIEIKIEKAFAFDESLTKYLRSIWSAGKEKGVNCWMTVIRNKSHAIDIHSAPQICTRR
jgi:hypothetical protein